MQILVIMMVEDSGNYLMIITPHSGQVSVHIENLNNKSQLDQIEDDPVCRRLSQSRGSEFDTPVSTIICSVLCGFLCIYLCQSI